MSFSGVGRGIFFFERSYVHMNSGMCCEFMKVYALVLVWQVNSKMLSTFFGSLMALDRSRSAN